MDGNKLTCKELGDVVERIAVLDKAMEDNNTPYTISFALNYVQMDDGVHHQVAQLYIHGENNEVVESARGGRDVLAMLARWENMILNVPSEHTDAVYKAIDKFREDLDFDLGICLERDAFLGVFNECMKKFREIEKA